MTSLDRNGPFWSTLVSRMLNSSSEQGHSDQNGRFGPFWSSTLSDSTSATPYLWDFPDFSGPFPIFGGLSRFVLFLFLSFLNLQRTFPKGLSGPFPKKSQGRKKQHKLRDKSLHRGFCTSGTRIWGRILGNEFWTPEFWTRILGSNFLTLFFLQQKRPPEKYTLKGFTSQNSPSKIQPRNRATKFTLPLCRAIWLT